MNEGYDFFWPRLQNPYFLKDGYRIDLDVENCVPFLVNRSGKYGSAFPSIGVATFHHKTRIQIQKIVVNEPYAFPDVVLSDEESVKP